MIALLVGLAIAGSVQLTWTAPGDDGTVGTATEYDLRYSLYPITEATFAACPRVGSAPLPRVAGTRQRCLVQGLVANRAYWFAIKTADEVPNWSAISNVVSKVAVRDRARAGSFSRSWGVDG